MTNEEAWRSSIEMMTAMVNSVNRDNGWHDDERPFSADIALLHSEVSEAYEAYRDYGGVEDQTRPTAEFIAEHGVGVHGLPKPLGVGSEMADVFIRLLDTCSRYDIDLVGEFCRKVTYNATRGFKHGGKVE